MTDLSKYKGCLLGGAAGDALGYPVEFLGEGAISARYGSRGVREYALVGGVAQISDDTQMTLFTAAGLLSGAARGGELLPAVAASYQDWLRTQTGEQFHQREEKASWLVNVPALWDRRAPGNTCMGALLDGRPVAGSSGCGGVMRVAPVGLFLPGLGWEQDEVDRFAGRCAALTHGGDMGYIPAAMLAHIVSRAVYGPAVALEDTVREATQAMGRLYADAPHIRDFLALMSRAADEACSDRPDREAIHALGEGWVGDEALAIAVYCALRYSGDFESALAAAVDHRGDSDSTGSIAGNILGAYLGVDAIPDKFLVHLELADVIETVAEDLWAGGPTPGAEQIWRKKYVTADYAL